MESRPPTPSPRQALSRFCRAVRPERCFLFGLGLNQEWVVGKDLPEYQSNVPVPRCASAGYARPYQRVPFPSRIGFPAYGRRSRGVKANTLWIDGSIRCSGAGACRRPVPESIPDRSPGHAFVPFARAGWCRHTKVRKLGALVGGRVLASLPQPAPPLWIPAFAGMTNWGTGMTRSRNGGVQRRARKWRRRIPDRSPGHAFVPIAHAGIPSYEN